MNLWPTGKNNEILSTGHPLELVVGHLLRSHQPRGSSCGSQWTVPLEPTAGEETSAHPCCPTGHCARQISSEERSLALPRPQVLCLVPSPTPKHTPMPGPAPGERGSGIVQPQAGPPVWPEVLGQLLEKAQEKPVTSPLSLVVLPLVPACPCAEDHLPRSLPSS